LAEVKNPAGRPAGNNNNPPPAPVHIEVKQTFNLTGTPGAEVFRQIKEVTAEAVRQVLEQLNHNRERTAWA